MAWMAFALPLEGRLGRAGRVGAAGRIGSRESSRTRGPSPRLPSGPDPTGLMQASL